MITTRRQAQALADLLAGLDPGLNKEQLSPYFQMLWDYVDGVSRDELEQYVMRLSLAGDDPKLVKMLQYILSLEPGQAIDIPRLADLSRETPAIEFLWEGWLPRGHLTALVGWPGIGKSYVGLWLAYLLEQNRPAPDGAPFRRTNGRVLFVDAEDFMPGIVERARAWGMTGENFYVMQMDDMSIIDLTQKRHQDWLWDMAYDLRPDLILIDSFSMISQQDDSSVADVRPLVEFLRQVVKSFNCAGLVIFHPRKPKDIYAPLNMFDLRGSGHILFIMRSIWGLEMIQSFDEDPNGPRRLKVMKSNFGLIPKPLTMRLERLTERVARPVFGVDEPAESKSLAHQCAAWLVDYLGQNGPTAYVELARAAKEDGYSENTLQAARKVAGEKVVDTVGPRKKGNKWALSET